jgi:hypothetical protein
MTAWILAAMVPVAWGFGRYWPKRVKAMPSFLVRARGMIMRQQYDASVALWDAVGGLVGNPSFQALFSELYRVHVWETDANPATDKNTAMVKQGIRKAVINLATILSAAEEHQKEKLNAAQRPASEGPY